ncbi:hypothetical protein SKAU_G00383160 [Synaphobranchus kaupii]|uniref:Uncharacterized protein n=1 Tax=Synaphobranchus kaupii TaxID=118154 RepID=A0A9Q1IEY5_SYNKA|nr:hypothetical protein SKAU_G00383160 [Synaphobranchus kaupii]
MEWGSVAALGIRAGRGPVAAALAAACVSSLGGVLVRAGGSGSKQEPVVGPPGTGDGSLKVRAAAAACEISGWLTAPLSRDQADGRPDIAPFQKSALIPHSSPDYRARSQSRPVGEGRAFYTCLF